MQGDRDPKTDSATSISGRTAAIDAAFADFNDEFDGDDFAPASADHSVDTPGHDDGPDSAGTEPSAASKPADKVDDAARPVEDPDSLSASKDPLKAPNRWSEDRRAAFEALPHDAQRIILERDKEANVAVTKATQEAAQFRRTHEGLNTAFTDHHREKMRSAGLDEIGAIQYLVQQHDALNRDPVGFLKAVIAQTRVTPDQLFGPQSVQTPQAEAETEWKDPAVIALEKQIAELQGWKTAEETGRQKAQQTEQQNYQSWFTQQCNAFENAMADDGTPKYPHLNSVIKDVVRLVQTDPESRRLLNSDPAKALEHAYNNALYLNPDIRQSLIDADYQRRIAERDAQNSVKKAQAAATRKGSPGANGQAQPKVNMSREEAINHAMNEHWR